jgi:hypothetical protein
MKLFHGTTLNKLTKILASGYLGTSKVVWEVSNPNTTYFYSEDKLRKENEECWFDEGIREALSNAEFSLLLETKNLRRIVLILDSEDLEKQGFKIEEDESCKDMDTYQVKGLIPVNLIKEIWVDTEDLDLYKLYFIGLVSSIQTRHENLGFCQFSLEITKFLDSLPLDIIEAAKLVYEKLEYFFIDNLENIERLEETSIEKLMKVTQ